MTEQLFPTPIDSQGAEAPRRRSPLELLKPRRGPVPDAGDSPDLMGALSGYEEFVRERFPEADISDQAAGVAHSKTIADLHRKIVKRMLLLYTMERCTLMFVCLVGAASTGAGVLKVLSIL